MGAGLPGLNTQGSGPSAGMRRDPRAQLGPQHPAQPPQPHLPPPDPTFDELRFAGDMDGLEEGPAGQEVQEPQGMLPGTQGMSAAEAAEFARQLAASGLNPDTLANVLATFS